MGYGTESLWWSGLWVTKVTPRWSPASGVHIIHASAETSMASSRRPLLCVINLAGDMSSATAMAGSCNDPSVSLVCHLVGLCDSPHILSLKSPVRMSTLLKVPSQLSMACCCAFWKGPCMLMINKGGHVRQCELDGQTRPFSPGVVLEYCDVFVYALMDEVHSIGVTCVLGYRGVILCHASSPS